MVSALTTDDVAEGDEGTGDMEVFEADAEGNDLLEFTELIPDKGGGRKKRQFGECLKT